MIGLKISVVVPTYKRAPFLKKCLFHLTSQCLDKQQYEIIVVSDGGDPDSEIVINDCKADTFTNIRFLSLPDKKGPAAARNRGWQAAKGSLVAFTDDDCLPAPTWLETILDKYKGEPEIAYTGKVIVPVSKEPTDYELNTKGLETGEFVTANCVLTKSALETISGFDEAFKAAWREDSDVHFTLLSKGIPIVKLNEAVVVHPVRNVPWGVSIKEQKKSLYNALLFKKFPVLYRQRIASSAPWRYYCIILFFIIFIVAASLQIKLLFAPAFTGWLYLTVRFVIKRLSATRKSFSHILEMVVTSVIIPFLSVYWRLYGAIKFRVLFF